MSTDIIDLIFERAQDDEKLQRRVSETQDIFGLTQHPGWAALAEHLKNGHETFMRGLASRLLGGAEAASLQREIDYARGAHDIAQAILRYPEITVANLEAVAARLYAAHLEEQAEAAIEASPYIDGDQEVA